MGSIYIAAISNQLSYASAPLPLMLTITATTNNQFKITWPSGTLQSADNAQGPYINMTNAVSPYLVSPSAAKQKFYRAKM